MASETRHRSAGLQDSFEPAGGLNSVCQENQNSKHGDNAILYCMKAETNLHSVSEKAARYDRDDVACFRSNGDMQSMKSAGTRRNLSCQIPPVTSESTVLSPDYQGDVNNVICDDAPVQYCSKPNCEYKKPKLYNTNPVCDKLTSSYLKVTPQLQRCAQLENHNFQNYVSTQDFRHPSKNITRHSCQKLNVKQLLLTLILQTCINFAAGKDVPVIQPATYQPCLIARSSSHLIYERHPNNCSVFYMCHGSKSWPMSCSQENTVFSMKHKVCVWRNSNFDDCQDKFANTKKDSLQESLLPGFTETRENNGQIKDGGSLTDTFLHENYNQGNGLKVLKSQNRAKQMLENVDQKYNPSEIMNHDKPIPIYAGDSLFPGNEKRVHRKLQTQKSVSGPGHDPLPLATKDTTDKSRNVDTKLTTEHTALKQNDDLTLVDAKETAPGQETVHESNYFSNENHVDNASEDEEIEEDDNDNTHIINQDWNVDQTGRVTVGIDNKNYIRTISQTSIKETRMGEKKTDTFDQTYQIDSTTRQPLQSEHSEIITELSSEEHSTQSSYYDYYDERTNEPLINDGFKEQTATNINERDAKRRIYSFDTSTKRTNEFHGFYKYANGIGDSSVNEDNVEITALPPANDKNTAITPFTIGSYLDSMQPAPLDDYEDNIEAPSRANEDVVQSTVNREVVSYPYNYENADSYNGGDSGNTRESVDKRSVVMGEKNGDTSRSISGIAWYDKSEESDGRGNVRMDGITNNVYDNWSQEVEEETTKTSDDEDKHGSSFVQVQTLLKKGHHLQDVTERSLRTSSYGQNVIAPLDLGKSWLKRQHERQTAHTTDRKTEVERDISTGKQVVHLNDDQKNPSNNLQFQDRTREKHFQKEHFSIAGDNYGRRKKLKFYDNVEENQFPKGSQNVRESNLHYSSLLRDKARKSVHTKVLKTVNNDKQTKQNEDDKANGAWYVINSGLHTQSTEDQRHKHKMLTPDLTQSMKTEFVDNSKKLKLHLTVEPWPQLTQKLHNKQTRTYNAIDNLRLMETFLRILNITVHRHDVPVKDVKVKDVQVKDVQVKDVQVKDIGTTKAPRLRSPGVYVYFTPTVLPKKSWTTERPADSSTHAITHLPPWKPPQDDFKIPKNHKDSILKGLIPKVKYDSKNSHQNNGRFFEDVELTEEMLEKETQYRDTLSQNEQIPRNRLVQPRPQQNQNQENQYKQKQQQHNQHPQNQQKHKQQDQHQQNQNQQNRSPQNQYQQNRSPHNQYQQNQYQQNQYQQNQNQQNQYQQNQHNHKQFEQTQLEHSQNKTLKKILRNDVNENQRRPNTRQHSSPQFWEVKVDRPWFEKLLNKDQQDIGKKKLFDQDNYENKKYAPQQENVKQPGIQISEHRQNYNLNRFRKQLKLNFDPNGKQDLHDSKMEQNIRRGINLKREDMNALDDDLKRNILLLQNENLHKHKQLLLDIRNKTVKKLFKIKMDQIENLYSENDIEYEFSDYEDADFSFMAQPVPVAPLPGPTKTPTTTTTTSQTTTSRSEDRKLPHSFDPDHVPAYRKQLKDRCGIMATPLIIGGQRSRRGQWPWQASLQIVTSTTPWHRCGGVLVHPKWVLTAAHCMEGSFYGETSNWRVVLADHNLETVSGNEVYRDVVRVISHPGYIRTSNFPNDVALLELDSPVDMTSGDVQTACMPDSNFPLVPGMKCWISGWGETRGTGGQENIMNEVTVDVLPHDQCKSMWGKVNIDVLDSQVCLGQGQTGACYGDSGGPLMCESEGRFFVAGVMSWLINNCSAANFPNVFTRLPNYTEWLYKELDYFEWMRHL